ncbi:MAG: 4Fe-4S dicluster domain-containing protein [Planctomycetes bacterium]|nr:4Fe-4S dicluster domain-containing protein [Planctomycetota bacterium]
MSDEKENISRRGLLRGDWIKQIRERGAEEIANEQEPNFVLKKPSGQTPRNRGFIQRPPHAVPESEFVVGCTKCDACLEACPPHAIFRTPESEGIMAGLPIIDADTQPCLMCDDMPCVPVCEAGVLRFDAPVAMGVAKIDSIACLAFRGTICTVCVERCPVEDAITMEAGRPMINSDICTGCGVCLYVCPAPGNAIHLLPNK